MNADPTFCLRHSVALPPIVLENSELELPLFASVKIYSNGISILSFQLDSTWTGIEVEDFIEEFVNLFKRYFEKVWIDSTIQKLDSDALMPYSFEDQLTIGGKEIKGRSAKRLVKDLRKQATATIDNLLSKPGKAFSISGEDVILHEVSDPKDVGKYESNLELCRSIYTHALSKIIVPSKDQRDFLNWSPTIWEGRPSVTIMRFNGQSENKSEIVKKFNEPISRIVNRTPESTGTYSLPTDLRPFNDFIFYGTRAILLCIWTKKKSSPADVWNNPNTKSILIDHQSRVENIEYYNMCLSRSLAFSWNPPSEYHLEESYQILNMAENDIHHASQAGEITDSLKYLLKAFGTIELVPSAKDSAKWHLEKMNLHAENKRIRIDRVLAYIFGLIGATGLAEFLINPFFKLILNQPSELMINLISFSSATTLVILFTLIVWATGRR